MNNNYSKKIIRTVLSAGRLYKLYIEGVLPTIYVIFIILQIYKVGVVLHKMGLYPIGSYPSQSMCNGAVFSFGPGQSGDSVRDGLIRSIIFSMPPNVQNQPVNHGMSCSLVPNAPPEPNKFL